MKASHKSNPPTSWNRPRSTVVATGPTAEAILRRHQGISASAAASTPQPAPADHARLYFFSTPPRLAVIVARSSRAGVQIGASKPRAARFSALKHSESRSRASPRVLPAPTRPTESAQPILRGPPTSTQRTKGGMLIYGQCFCQAATSCKSVVQAAGKHLDRQTLRRVGKIEADDFRKPRSCRRAVELQNRLPGRLEESCCRFSRLTAAPSPSSRLRASVPRCPRSACRTRRPSPDKSCR